MPNVMIVDDDAAIRDMLRALLEDEDFTVTEAETGSSVVEALSDDSRAPDLIMMDVRMPDKSGIEVLQDMKSSNNGPLPVIVMTAYGTSNVAIQAMQHGAYDYLTKPFDLDDVLMKIRRFFDRKDLSDQLSDLSARIDKPDLNDLMVGNSAAMQDVYKTVGKVARSDATVMITGETGTGKELIASTLHETSAYARGPFIKVNCAALPETLLESELFGHEKGAFTGALNQRKGRFEMANKGSIFLDEIGEMTLSTQKKLLRVLQEREFERVGGSVSVKIDTRVIVATNKVLQQEIEANRFREDLYYRLNVISIFLPPLRDRKDDLPLLIEHFLHKHRFNSRSDPARMSQQAMDALMDYDWPGNVRELENVIARAVVDSQGAIITPEHISFFGADSRRLFDLGEQIRRGTSLDDLLRTLERSALEEALSASDGDRADAAALLGLKLAQFNKRASAHELS
ncbi:MAG: sigma-54-dependent Fis family transcriptional regulator [Chloroflexia bacterium]|nr:sigma-54-dependent Fis family transcriptional regulator [Chloroflexia bacterium]